MDKKNEFKICPYPFSKIDLGAGNARAQFIPCCGAWLTDEYHNKFDNKINVHSPEYDLLWNSKQAEALRESIYDGSYKYCLTDRCNKPQMSLFHIKTQNKDYFETPISTENLEAIENRKTTMPGAPTTISMSHDFKCNLECPTCRNELITTTNEYKQGLLDNEVEFVKSSQGTVEVIKLANNGEVFFSKDQREFLKSINSFDYPNLKYVFVVTNGLLLNQKNYEALLPGSSFIKKVSLSIDAGDEETYKVTRGGNWKILQQNLKWIQSMRKKGEFLTVAFNFVVRKANYESIDAFVQMARDYDVDQVEFIEFDNWNEIYLMTNDLSIDYKSEAIHLKEHPDHYKLKDVLKKYQDDPKVQINISGLFN